LVVVDSKTERAAAVASSIGDAASAVNWIGDGPPPAGVDAVACAVPAGLELPFVRSAMNAGIPIATSVDDHEAIRDLLALRPATTKSWTALVGCGLSPGLSDLLARHAGAALDAVDEVHVARVGVAGPSCQSVVKRALRDRSLEWRGGRWHDEDRRAGHELVWFPDPIGARECERVAGGIWCLAEGFPDASRISVRLANPDAGARCRFSRRQDDASWGATRVEVWGRQGSRRSSIVYGVVERTAIAAGTTLAVSTLALVGLVPDLPPVNVPGVHGLAASVEPVPMLAELARRGVKAAIFEGVGER